MQLYVDACARHENSRRLGELLDRIVVDRRRHARFVNTLARLEYVGVRKMLKSRRADRLDIEGLQHVLDEAVHALRLKKAALALAGADARADGGGDGSGGAGGAGAVRTFAAADTLAGDAGEAYFQALDHRAEAVIADVAPAARAEANYLLTSAAIEVRAQVFYPLYEARLRASGAPFSVSSITKDEDRHLGEMTAGLEAALGGQWRRYLEPTLAAEEALFARFLDAVDAALAQQ